ncbi:TrmO family methyltransferase [Streptomyces sp. NPDC001668]|uniref:TrmO family methyltransferase domain-containing protein n=1 Tax=unclassified Streptomyces TaxID=2593676 RepID=UPI0036CDE3DA
MTKRLRVRTPEVQSRLNADRFGPEALNTDWPLVGIFAQRGTNRPNRIGVSRCRLLHTDGLDIHIQGLDTVDGTPVLDIKPYLAEFGPQGPTHQPAWAAEIMREYH